MSNNKSGRDRVAIIGLANWIDSIIRSKEFCPVLRLHSGGDYEMLWAAMNLHARLTLKENMSNVLSIEESHHLRDDMGVRPWSAMVQSGAIRVTKEGCIIKLPSEVSDCECADCVRLRRQLNNLEVA